MKILAIRGQNLASLKGRFEIDLAAPPLSSLGLFAIAGPVGAGKSTLLDAVALALFGRTPRLSGRGGAPVGDERDAVRANDPRSIVRRGSALAFAEVDFTGRDGGTYRARWQVRRARGQAFGRLLDDETSLLCLRTGVLVAGSTQEVRRAIQERLGLSFDEMCRSVLLSQGGFAAFLQARPNERAELLEKMTGTEIYGELSQRAFRRARAEQQQLAVLQDERDRLTLCAPDALAALQQQGEALSVERATLGERALRLGVLAERRQSLLTRQAAYQEARARRDGAEEGWQRAVAQDQVCATALQTSAPVLAAARTLDAQLQALELPGAVRAAETAQQGHQEHLTRLQVLVSAVGRAQQAMDRAEQQLRDPAALVLGQAGTLRRQLERLDALSTTLQGMQALQMAVAQQLEAAEGELVVRRDEHQLRAQRLQQQRAALPEGLRACSVLAGRSAVARQQQRRAREQEATLAVELRVEERALERIAHAEARRALVDGEACPLCGATEHPWRHQHDSGSVQVQRDAVAALRLQVAAQRDAAAAAQARDVELARRGGAALQAEQVELAHTALDDAALAELDGALVEAEGLERLCADVLAQRDDQQRCVQELHTQHTFQLREHEAARAEHHALQLTLREALSTSGLWPSDQAMEPRAVARALKRRAQELQDARARADAARAEQGRLQQEQQVAQVARDASAARLEAAQLLLAQAQQAAAQLQEQRAALKAPADTAAALARMEADAEAARQGLRSAEQAVGAAREAERGAAEELARVESTAALDDVDAELAAVRAALARAEDADAALRALLLEDQRQRARAEALDAAMATQRAASAVWGELSELIGSHDGARFRAFAQGLTLQTLVHHANQQLALLAPRYRLERVTSATAPALDLQLAIIDRDAGDERRGVQSLSGGETFLVSLALALGLASLSSGRVRVESLFIDEGFSSLDPDTLETALAAFDALRSTGRQIGVISHVPALAERLGSQIRVLPLGDGRSRVEVRLGS